MIIVITNLQKSIAKYVVYHITLSQQIHEHRCKFIKQYLISFTEKYNNAGTLMLLY